MYARPTRFRVLMRYHVVVLSSALLLSAGCSSNPSQRQQAPAPLVGRDVSLVVENRNQTDLTLFIQLNDGSRVRIGRSTAATTSTITVPSHVLGQTGAVRFVAEPIGTRSGFASRVISDVVVARPGAIVEWVLDSRLARSAIAIR